MRIGSQPFLGRTLPSEGASCSRRPLTDFGSSSVKPAGTETLAATLRGSAQTRPGPPELESAPRHKTDPGHTAGARGGGGDEPAPPPDPPPATTPARRTRAPRRKAAAPA